MGKLARLIGLAVVLGGSSADATLLNLTLPSSPDIVSQFIDVSWANQDSIFHADGFALSIRSGSGEVAAITDGLFAINIKTDGTTAASGTAVDDLLVTGNVTVDGTPYSGTLLTGQIAQFGSSPTFRTGLFEFVFDTSGGALAPLFGSQFGVVLGMGGAQSTYFGEFLPPSNTTRFGNTNLGVPGDASADLAPIPTAAPLPEPSTLLLVGGGIAALVLYTSRRRISESAQSARPKLGCEKVERERNAVGSMRFPSRAALVLIPLLLGLGVSMSASAVLINESLLLPMLTFDSAAGLRYDAASQTLTVEASPLALRGPGGGAPDAITPVPGAGKSFKIEIHVGSNGLSGVAGDDLSVFGQVDLNHNGSIDPGESGLLLTGEILNFGAESRTGATDMFDFVFTTTGGLLNPLFNGLPEGPAGTLYVLLQSERSSFTGGFLDDFSGGAKGTLGATPEPSAAVLLGAGLLGLATRGRTRLRR